MKFVIAPDKFKGSLTGPEFCTIVAKELLEVFPKSQILQIPLADGGDGTIEVVQSYLEASYRAVTVNDPLFRPVKASYLLSKDHQTAFVEMSEASGYRLLVPDELDCMKTTTLGTGELIVDALKQGAKNIYLGLGGSATNDGGIGMATALGYQFLDEFGRPLTPTGENLIKVHHIRRPQSDLLKGVEFKIACDVQNPFYGTNGAAYVYAAQKGASTYSIAILDAGLKQLAAVVANTMQLHLQEIPGSGAAGGLGGGAVAFLNGQLVSGIELVKQIADFDHKITGADWIITGEGNLDKQTLSGKTIGGVVSSAKKKNIPVAAFCGGISLSLPEERLSGLNYATSVLKGVSDLPTALKTVKANLAHTTYNFALLVKSAAKSKA